ncbi:MAG TPA: GspH/FimT family pseudopilin [Thermoanaerobaculia bacterium]|nr:GspH/FimT family pseudopilin [Thermoanaerobaculia bacterium]
MSKLQLRPRAGFTLVEALVSIVILATLTLVGLPAFLEYMTRSQLLTTGQQTQALLARARHMAVKQRAPAIVEPSGDQVVGFLDEDDDTLFDEGTEPLLGRVPLPTQVTWDGGPPYQARFEANGSVTALGQFGFATGKDYELVVRITDLASARVELVPNW